MSGWGNWSAASPGLNQKGRLLTDLVGHDERGWCKALLLLEGILLYINAAEMLEEVDMEVRSPVLAVRDIWDAR